MLASGPLLEARKRQARELGIEDLVVFRGDVPHEEIPALLASAQIYLSASSSDGASSSLLEAMACGIFPVLSRIPANTGWIEDGRAGLYFEVGNATELTDQIERALDDPTLRAQAGQLNRERVETDANMHANMLRLEQLLVDTATRP